MKHLLLFLVISLRAFAAENIPDVVTPGAYSISFSPPDGPWSLQIFKEAQAARYIYAGMDGIEAFRLTIFRVGIPTERVSLSTADLVRELVARDGLRFQQLEYDRRVQFRVKPDRLEVAAGTAYIYSDAFKDGVAHYATVALLLPPDYKVRQVGFLVVAHQIGSRRAITPLQEEYVHLVLKGLKEANKAPEPTTTSVTSPAAQEPRQP